MHQSRIKKFLNLYFVLRHLNLFRSFNVNNTRNIVMTIDAGFGMVTGFIGYLQLVIGIQSKSSRIYTVYSSLQHALNLLSLLCLHQPSGNGFSRRDVPFLWVPELSSCLSYGNFRLSPKY
jgi:hypothetical protein